MPIVGKFFHSLGRRLKSQPDLDGAAIDAQLASDGPMRQSLARELVNLGNAGLARGLPQLPALIVWIVNIIGWW